MKLTYIQFNEKLVDWYDKNMPNEKKPNITSRMRLYGGYSMGQTFNFLQENCNHKWQLFGKQWNGYRKCIVCNKETSI